MDQDVQFINNIFKQLTLSTINLQSQAIQKCQTTSTNLTGFQKSCFLAKVKILVLILQFQHKNSTQYVQYLCSMLKLLSCSNQYLIQKGLINLYIDIYDEKKKGKDLPNHHIPQICSQILKSLEQLVSYFFLQHELQQFRRHKSLLQTNFSITIESKEGLMEQKIRERVSTKKFSQMFEQYLKDHQANKNKQLCRICYKNIDVNDLIKHVEYCGKKMYTKQLLNQNFQKRLQIVNKLKEMLLNLKTKSEQKIDAKCQQVIKNIVNFYRNLTNNNKKKRKNSIRYRDTNISLFFYEDQSNMKNQFKLLSQLSTLEDKAFCLNKRLQQIQSQYFIVKEEPQMKKSKKFPNLKLKKYQTISKSIDEPLSPTIDPPNESKLGMNKEKNNQIMNKIQQIKQEQNDFQQAPKYQRRIKKKLTDCQRYSVTKSQSNNSDTNYCALSINNFQILKLLGKGAFGRVYLVRRRKTQDVYALKAIKIDKNWGQSQLQLIKNQYGIYKKIAGDHLVTATFSFQQRNVQFFVLQFIPGGDLSKILQQYIYLDQKDAKFCLAQILLAIEHLHNSQIIHRDLKPQNIVLDSQGHIKLTDFGLSQIRVQNKIQKARENKKSEQKQEKQQQQERYSKAGSKKKSISRNKNNKKLVGTPDYIAPEVILGTSLANPTIDWWSFGVIAYQMLIGCRPFSANTIELIFYNIQKGDIQWPQIGYQQDMMHPIAADFVKSLLKKDFNQRLGFKGVEQIKNHQFFKGIDWKNLKTMSPPSSFCKQAEQVQHLKQNIQLRKQIQVLMGSNEQNRLQQLKNYVRYDLLTAQTLISVEKTTTQKQKRLRKLMSITCNLQNIESNESGVRSKAFSLSKNQLN